MGGRGNFDAAEIAVSPSPKLAQVQRITLGCAIIAPTNNKFDQRRISRMAAGSRYSDQQRREAVTLYLLHGNWKEVSELTGIPQRTLNDWALQPWFATLFAEVRAEKGAELDVSTRGSSTKRPSSCLTALRMATLVLWAGK